ncbi:hypothetical protein IHI24_000878 [Rickettsia endosymbiont of Cardiosporidium cionae]|nr:hypothetical protein IHI24_000878 [Rickettsia endosymbiont of Cardiosporidium cionae]
MLKLNFPKEKYWIDVGLGVKLFVRPCTTAVFCQAKAHMMQNLKSAMEEFKTEKLEKKLEEKSMREAIAEEYLVIGLAVVGIEKWSGVYGEDGKELAVSNEAIEELFKGYWTIAENFRTKYTEYRNLLEEEKKR